MCDCVNWCVFILFKDYVFECELLFYLSLFVGVDDDGYMFEYVKMLLKF